MSKSVKKKEIFAKQYSNRTYTPYFWAVTVWRSKRFSQYLKQKGMGALMILGRKQIRNSYDLKPKTLRNIICGAFFFFFDELKWYQCRVKLKRHWNIFNRRILEKPHTSLLKRIKFNLSSQHSNDQISSCSRLFLTSQCNVAAMSHCKALEK